jgi:hypothetical protein
MSVDDNSGKESIETRTRRALEDPLTVLTTDLKPVDEDTSIVTVTSHSGSEYTVDVREGRCTCPDQKHRDPEGGCKHIRRARIALGHDSVDSETLARLDIDAGLGVNAPGPVVTTSDGGVVGDDAEVIEQSAHWEGPFVEFDKYGEATGAEYVRCSGCGREVLEGREETATHSADCPKS